MISGHSTGIGKGLTRALGRAVLVCAAVGLGATEVAAQTPPPSLPDRGVPMRVATFNVAEPGSDRIRVLIKEQYRGQRPSLDVISGQLQMSSRSLRRHLQQNGINFTQLLDEIQREIANMLLQHPSMSVKRVALQLGFEEPSSFSRAYKRWSGISPQQYRDEQRGQAGDNTASN